MEQTCKMLVKFAIEWFQDNSHNNIHDHRGGVGLPFKINSEVEAENQYIGCYIYFS
jgi:hypothetical protein